MSKFSYAIWNSIRKMKKDKKVLCFFAVCIHDLKLSKWLSNSQKHTSSSRKLQGECVCKFMDCQESASKVPVRAVKC